MGFSTKNKSFKLKNTCKSVLFLLLSVFTISSASAQTEIITNSAENPYLIDGANDYSLSQTIYLQSELGLATTITGCQFYWDGSIAKTFSVELYLAHTSKSIFSGNTDWEPAASFTNVFTGNYTKTVAKR